MKTFKNLFFGFAAFALIVVLLSAAFPGFPTAKIFPFDMRIVGHLTVDSNLMVGDTIQGNYLHSENDARVEGTLSVDDEVEIGEAIRVGSDAPANAAEYLFYNMPNASIFDSLIFKDGDSIFQGPASALSGGIQINDNTNNYVLTATGKQDTIQGESEFIYSGGNGSISSETAASFGLNYYTATGGNYSQLVLGKYNGTKGSYDALDDNDYLGAVNFGGSESSSFSLTAASIQVQATEDWTTSANGVEMKFNTTGIGEASSTTRMVIDDEINLQSDTYFDGATAYHSIGTLAEGDATPDVARGNVFQSNYSLASVTITDLDNPVPGAFYTLIGNSDVRTLDITDGGNFSLTGNWSGGQGDVIVLFCIADDKYIEISRSDN